MKNNKEISEDDMRSGYDKKGEYEKAKENLMRAIDILDDELDPQELIDEMQASQEPANGSTPVPSPVERIEADSLDFSYDGEEQVCFSIQRQGDYHGPDEVQLWCTIGTPDEREAFEKRQYVPHWLDVDSVDADALSVIAPRGRQ